MATEQVASAASGRTPSLGVQRILDLCDGILREPGRRAHRFAWLTAPGAGREGWLPVDAYYPGSRLVIVCRGRPAPHDAVYAELVPAHGLRLLRLDPRELDGDLEAAELALRRMIAGLDGASWPAGEARSGGLTSAQPAAPRPPARTARPAAAARSRSTHTVQAGLLLGLALVAVLLVEVYAGVVEWGLDGGHVVLAFGLALDVCARAVGTIAAGRAGEEDWAWGCALGGSPVVAGFADAARREEIATDSAPLAALLATLAVAALILALLSTIL